MTLAQVARAAVVVALLGTVITLALAFRRDPHDIKTGTIGKPAPEFTLDRLDGSGKVALSDLAGKIVVVNFFASWCLPCTEENPALVRVYERYRTSDVVMLGVDYQESRDSGLAYATRMGMGWATVADDDGRVALSYGVFGPPETFFIGADGVIAGRHIGPIDETTLVTAIEQLRDQAATR
ncbi:MAG TPA: redoxin domain-containing protein [Candidatus Limnocylindria bacterium]|jgi:cytochrome c biogenesis protein CcmG/thiol:disulfide interchange protein DsbE